MSRQIIVGKLSTESPENNRAFLFLIYGNNNSTLYRYKRNNARHTHPSN